MRKIIVAFILGSAALTSAGKVEPAPDLPQVLAAAQRGFLEGIAEEPKIIAACLKKSSDDVTQWLYDVANKDIIHFSLLLPRAQACFFSGFATTLFILEILVRRISDEIPTLLMAGLTKYARLLALIALISSFLVSLGDNEQPHWYEYLKGFGQGQAEPLRPFLQALVPLIAALPKFFDAIETAFPPQQGLIWASKLYQKGKKSLQSQPATIQTSYSTSFVFANILTLGLWSYIVYHSLKRNLPRFRTIQDERLSQVYFIAFILFPTACALSSVYKTYSRTKVLYEYFVFDSKIYFVSLPESRIVSPS